MLNLTSTPYGRRIAATAAVFAFAIGTPLLTTAASAAAPTATCKGEEATYTGTPGRDVFNGGPGRASSSPSAATTTSTRVVATT